jgi:hypothetical protein
MENNKQPKRESNNGVDRRVPRKKILVPVIIAVTIGIIASVGIITYMEQQAQAQNVSLGQLANSLKPIHPQVIVVPGKLDNVNGAALTEIAKNNVSGSIARENDVSMPVQKQGQAEIALYTGVAPDGNDIISVTITNVGTEKFYLKEFAIGGETSTGIAPLAATALDSDYSPSVYGSIPKPAMTQLVTMNPGESLSAYIKGKFTEQTTGQPITKFGGSALYYYEQGTPDYNSGFNWSIAVTN